LEAVELREYLLHLRFQFRDSRTLNIGNGRKWAAVGYGTAATKTKLVMPRRAV
jgi:hypothetical protein